jgi:hypothetical protein
MVKIGIPEVDQAFELQLNSAVWVKLPNSCAVT